jgi:serine O-acetyltransferase
MTRSSSRRASHRERLDHPDVSGELIRQAYADALEDDPTIGDAFRADIVATIDRDPAAHRYIDPLLYFKGFHAIQTHRLAHWLWNKGRKDFALYLQSRSSRCSRPTSIRTRASGAASSSITRRGCRRRNRDDRRRRVDPARRHARRHRQGERGPPSEDPRGVMIGAGAKILGNIEVGPLRAHRGGLGRCSRRCRTTPRSPGVPARVVGTAGCAEPSRAMDQMLYDLGP